LALLSTTRPIADPVVANAVAPIAVDPMDDQRAGAGIMWGIGDVIGIAAGLVVVHQWMRHEEREARRLDRRADARRLAGSVEAA
jgi:putative copper resistance protein D